METSAVLQPSSTVVPTNTTILEAKNLCFSYGAVQALRNVSIDVAEKKITCIMGRNGVGKTTLLRNLIGTLRSSSGSVTLGGKDITALPANARVREGLGLVPQGRQIFPALSVRDNLRVALSGRTGRGRSVPEEVFEYFPVLKQMEHRLGGDLSGGQQQQLAIARALVGDPKVLLLDEPTEGIQPNIITQIGHILRRLVVERGMTIVIVEQYIDFIREFTDHFYIMTRGAVVTNGPTDTLSREMAHSYLSV